MGLSERERRAIPPASNAKHGGASDLRGARIAGRYVLGDLLGKGGMGSVYRAADESSGGEVALKLLARTDENPRMAALFEREYHTLAGLRHPSIIEVHDYGVSEHGAYYTMELLDGRDLRDLAPLPYKDACRHLRDVASSLALLHSRRLIHRDLSPRNVRLTKGGRGKLIDFGALSTFGLAKEIVGTPLCVAPEAMYGAPLDQRADLFALGALSYWLLTSRHAFPAKTLQELPLCWRNTPLSPSTFVDGIPPELDALVMSLLSVDPLARPSSAAAVIEALTALGGLEVEVRQSEAESYLESRALVGRDDELERLRTSLTRALEGNGGAVVIEAEGGMGKTRLLNEIALEAQLGGATVLSANAADEPGLYGVAKSLGSSLLRALPDDALREAKPFARVLGHLSEELHERLGGGELDAVPALLAEGRARLLDAMQRWMLAVTLHHPLVIAVDNLHSADESSAAFVAALAKEARMRRVLVAATLTPSRDKQLSSPVQILRRGGTRVRLGNLRASHVDELVRTLFGDPSHASRLAKWLYERSAGSPFECLELARYAVRKGIIKYIDGAWVLPQDLATVELPSRLDEVLAARFADLGARARSLAEALSVDTGNVSLERCLLLSEGTTEREMYAALDELVAKDILVGAPGGYRFSQDALRQRLQSGMDDERRRRLHKKLADALLAASEKDPAERFEAAFHLVRGGEKSRGADLLTEVALDPTLSREHVEQTVRGLQAALEIYEAEGRSDYERAPVLLQLAILSYYVDWRLVIKYGERAVDLGFELTGLTLAQKLRRYLGRKLALVVALIIAGFRFARARRRGAKISMKDAITLACTAGPAVVGVAVTCLDKDAAGRLVARLEPLSYFGRNHVGGVLYDFCDAAYQLSLGRLGTFERLQQAAKSLENPGAVRGLGESARKAFHAGCLIGIGMLEAGRLGRDALETADRLEALGLRLYAAAADQIRYVYHACRGEADLAQRHLERIELHAVQGGSTWQAEIFMPTIMGIPALMTRDIIAARRCYEQTEHQSKEIPSLAISAVHARGLYLLLRGDARGSIEAEEQVIAATPPRASSGWQYPLAVHAAALNVLGEHQRAREACLDALKEVTPAEKRFVITFADLGRELAVAEIGLGMYAEAAARVDTALTESEGGDNPLYIGLLHKVRAEVALAARDAAAFEMHITKMGDWFRRTSNPVLILQWERLKDAGIRYGLPTRAVSSENTIPPGERAPAELTSVRTLLAEGDARARGFRDLLLKLLGEAGAAGGYLYIAYADRLELAAQRAHAAPADWLWDEVENVIRNVRSRLAAARSHSGSLPLGSEVDEADDDDELESTLTVESAPLHVQVGAHFYRIVLLVSRRAAQRQIVGAVALELEPQAPMSLRTESLVRVADAVVALMDPAHPSDVNTPRPSDDDGRQARTQSSQPEGHG